MNLQKDFLFPFKFGFKAGIVDKFCCIATDGVAVFIHFGNDNFVGSFKEAKDRAVDVRQFDNFVFVAEKCESFFVIKNHKWV